MKIEAIANSVQDVSRLNAAKADIILLAKNMEFGGYTPYIYDIVDATEITKAPIHVIVRRTHEDWLMHDDELLESIMEDIDMIKNTKAKGIVVGFLTDKNAIDEKTMKKIIKEAKGLEITFSKAFDEVEDKEKALKILKDLGIHRLHTTGGNGSLEKRLTNIKKLISENLEIVVTGDIDFKNVKDFLKIGAKTINVGTTLRIQPTEEELEIGETQEITLKLKEGETKPKIKIIEPKPFNPWEKSVDIERTQEFKAIKKND